MNYFIIDYFFSSFKFLFRFGMIKERKKTAGAELCQAQFRLGLGIQEVRLSAIKYPASQLSKSFTYTDRFSR